MTAIDIVQITAAALGGFGVLLAGLGYGYGKLRGGRDEALRQSNQDLRDRVEDQEDLIEKLRDDVQLGERRVERLTGKIEILTKKNNGYEELIYNALQDYFSRNPDSIVELKTTVKKKK